MSSHWLGNTVQIHLNKEVVCRYWLTGTRSVAKVQYMSGSKGGVTVPLFVHTKLRKEDV